MMKAEIITCNSKFENGKCIGGYHETHRVGCLNIKEHLIATIRSIIENNLKYGCDDTILETVMVGCNDHSVVEYINKNLNSIFSDYPYLKVGICIGALDSF